MLSPELEILIMAYRYCDAIKFGTYTLKHGGEDSMYLNLRLAQDSKLEGGINRRMGRVTARELEKITSAKGLVFDCVMGVPRAADPFAESLSSILHKSAVRLEADREGKITGFATPRPPEGCTILVVENVITTAKSAFRVIDFAQKEGYRVSDVLSVVDRESGAEEVLQSFNTHLTSLLTSNDILDTLMKYKDEDIDTELCERVRQHAREIRAKTLAELLG